MKCMPIQMQIFFRVTAFFLVSVLVALFISIPQAHAVANDKIHYQGKLLDSGGSPVTDGSHTMRFRFYTVSTGGTDLWDETQTVTTTGGLFTALLGSVTSLSGIDWNQALYLGVTVDSDSEMTPRHTVGAVPAAHTLAGALRLDSTLDSYLSGSLGIGTTTPISKLSVVGSGTGFALRVDNTSTGDGIQIHTEADTANNGLLWSQGGSNILNIFSTATNQAILRLASSTTTMVELSASGISYFNAGRIGIGTTTPSSILHTFGSDDASSRITVQRTGASSSTNILGYNYIGTFSTNPLRIFASSTEYMRITADGDVGIGTTSPGSKLTVEDVSSQIQLNNPSTANISRLFLNADGNLGLFVGTSTGPEERLTIDGGTGNIGIGTTTPTAQLHTTGSVRFQTFGSGTLTTDANGNLSVSSDERLKNVEGSFTNGLAAIRGLEPIRYRWNAESGLEQESIYAGFSAQNVMDHIEDAVGIDKNTGYFTLSDRPIIAASVNAIKELDIAITELASSTAPTENEAGEKTFVGKFFDRMVGWFANAANGIGNLFANSFRAKDTLCINDTCVDESKLRELLGDTSTTTTTASNDSSSTEAGTTTSTATSTDSTATSTATTTVATATTTATTTDPVADEEPPVITLNGDASVTIEYEGTYAEEGATATDNVDTDVEVVITGTVDTGVAGTYTITYTATDAAGNEAVVTREIIVDSKIEPEPEPTPEPEPEPEA